MRFSTPEQPFHRKLDVQQLLEEAQPTTSRFSLVREGFAENEVKDLISETPVNGYLRLMVVKSSLVSPAIYQKLADNDVPQLPRITSNDNTPEGTEIFGIKPGLKLLAHEAIFNRESSGTYIGDPEIFTQLGFLYGNAWRTTGLLLLDGGGRTDSPLDHVAISSFSDGSSYLFLCPPYLPETPLRDSFEEAEGAFTQAIQNKLEMNLGARLYDSDTIALNIRLIEAARTGFEAGA
jgi:hypothetical protein